jgi:hypothetical protein
MSAVTIGEAWPGFGRSFTVDELDRMPDDGHRYELMDGALIVSPRPTTVHQAVAGRLYGILSGVCPEDLLVVPEPAVQLDAQTGFDPDPAAPELTVFELRDGRYFLAATSTQPLTVAHPFEVTIVPANLTKGLPR